MAINSVALAEMDIPDSYLEALPKVKSGNAPDFFVLFLCQTLLDFFVMLWNQHCIHNFLNIS
jgi:hypothetical protein